MVAKTQIQPSELPRVIVFSERHAMLAEMEATQRRLSDAINDPLHKVIRLDNVMINSVERMDECLARHDQVSIRREAIQAILVLSEPQRPAHQRLSNFVPKQAIRMAALLPSFHIVGNVFVSGKIDPVSFVLDGQESFAVLSDASVTMTGRIDKPITVQTAMINRKHILLATPV